MIIIIRSLTCFQERLFRSLCIHSLMLQEYHIHDAVHSKSSTRHSSEMAFMYIIKDFLMAKEHCYCFTFIFLDPWHLATWTTTFFCTTYDLLWGFRYFCGLVCLFVNCLGLFFIFVYTQEMASCADTYYSHPIKSGVS